MEHHVSKDLLNSRYSASALGGKGGMVVALSSGRHLFFHAVGEGTGKQIESIGAAHGSSGASIVSMLVRGAANYGVRWDVVGWGGREVFCCMCVYLLDMRQLTRGYFLERLIELCCRRSAA